MFLRKVQTFMNKNVKFCILQFLKNLFWQNFCFQKGLAHVDSQELICLGLKLLWFIKFFECQGEFSQSSQNLFIFLPNLDIKAPNCLQVQPNASGCRLSKNLLVAFIGRLLALVPSGSERIPE